MKGKRFVQDGQPFPVRGVTYGSFLPRSDGFPFPAGHVVRRDFQAMRARGLNTVRSYAVPPPDVVEAAEEFGLRLLVGLDYADWRMSSGPSETRRVLDAGRRAVDDALAACAGREGVVLGLVVGNEVPADLVRLEGRERIENVLSKLVSQIHDGDPDLLVTYCQLPVDWVPRRRRDRFCRLQCLSRRGYEVEALDAGADDAAPSPFGVDVLLPKPACPRHLRTRPGMGYRYAR